jgi:hypothetical protein
VDDLIAVIVNWGPCSAFPCPGDATSCAEGGNVDVDDMIAVILAWGPCPGQSCNPDEIAEDYADCEEYCAQFNVFSNCIRDCLCGKGWTEFCE